MYRKDKELSNEIYSSLNSLFLVQGTNLNISGMTIYPSLHLRRDSMVSLVTIFKQDINIPKSQTNVLTFNKSSIIQKPNHDFSTTNPRFQEFQRTLSESKKHKTKQNYQKIEIKRKTIPITWAKLMINCRNLGWTLAWCLSWLANGLLMVLTARVPSFINGNTIFLPKTKKARRISVDSERDNAKRIWNQKNLGEQRIKRGEKSPLSRFLRIWLLDRIWWRKRGFSGRV